MLNLQSVTFKEACEFIARKHRHHKPPRGWKFGTAVNNGEKIVGVIMIGRPVSRHLDDGQTLEVTRCCTDGTKNAGSKLYGAAYRAAKALGYKRLVTYTLSEEPGVSLLASNYQFVKESPGGSWSCKSRPRVDKHPLGKKLLWEVDLT